MHTRTRRTAGILRILFLLIAAFLFVTAPAAAQQQPAQPDVLVGFAKLEITPTHPVMLHGYGSRTAEATEADQPLHVRVIALRDPAPDSPPLVWAVIDNCAVTAEFTAAVRSAIAQSRPGLTAERFTLSVTHAHSAPMLTDTINAIFGKPLTPQQAANVERYTEFLADRIHAAVLAALDNLQPATLSWTSGSAPFAANRRVITEGRWTGFGYSPDAPTDHNLPILVAKNPAGQTIGLIASYPCHCTTIGGDYNKVFGDWAATAAQQLEAEHDNFTSLIVIGAGADSNPYPRGSHEQAIQHGQTIATEINRLLNTQLTPLHGTPNATLTHAQLPLDVYSKEELTGMLTANNGNFAYFAQTQLDNLERDGKLRDTVSLPVAVWAWPNELAIVSIGGEVVADYALKLYDQHPGGKLWVNAYTNAVPCYIPTQRVIMEGGYEFDTNMHFYQQPGVFNPAVEPTLLETINNALPQSLR